MQFAKSKQVFHLKVQGAEMWSKAEDKNQRTQAINCIILSELLNNPVWVLPACFFNVLQQWQ